MPTSFDGWGSNWWRRSCERQEGHVPGLREPVTIDLGGLGLVVLPDEVRGDGAATVYRRVRTGRRRKEEEDDLVYAAYLMAAGLRHGAGARVEAIHLSGDGVMDIPLTPRKRTNRERKLRLIAEGILACDFPRNLTRGLVRDARIT